MQGGFEIWKLANFLSEFRVSIILKCLGNFDQIGGAIYFTVFLPNLTVSNLGNSKSLFLKLY